MLDDGCDIGREVGVDILERGERHGADAVIGIDGLDAAADAVLIGDTARRRQIWRMRMTCALWRMTVPSFFSKARGI